MADNYLGRKMEEYFSTPRQTVRRPVQKLRTLLERNRSYRGFDSSFEVREDQLKEIISVYRLTPSAMNRQPLRFRMVLKNEAEKILPFIHLGSGLKELHLPLKGEEPNAFIVICSVCDEDPYVDMDLGIAAQSMLLRAVEIGLNGICIGAFDRKEITETLNLPLRPILVLAIGKGAETIRLADIDASESRMYYRRDGIHYVPKIRLEDLIIE